MIIKVGLILKIAVTIVAFGQAPFTEVLPKEYPVMHADKCEEDVNDIIARAHEGVTVTAMCVPAQTRGA